MRFTLIDVLVVAGELAVLTIAFLIVWWLIWFLFKRLELFPGLHSRQELLASARKRCVYLLTPLWIVFSLLILGINATILARGNDLLPTTLEFVGQLPPEFWANLVGSTIRCAIVLGFALFIQRPLSYWLDRASQFVQDSDRFTENDLSIDQFFQALKMHLGNGIWLGAFCFCSDSFKLETLSEYLLIFLKIYLIVAIGLLLLKVVNAVIDSLDAWSAAYMSENAALRSYAKLRTLVPFLKRCIEYGIYLGIATLALAQIEPLISLTALGTRAIGILGIILASRILIEVSALVVKQLLTGEKALTDDQLKRRLTLVPIVQSLLKYGIYFWSGILILRAVDIDPGPILAAAGILGLAVGLGAQNLINDTVSGFFILFENYYLVGDYIEVEEAEGIVEAIELRTTRIRHPNGQLQILRNGDITSIVNFSREYIYAVVDVGVAYDSDLNVVYRVIEEVGFEIKEMFPKDVLEPTEVDGLEAFGHSKLMVRAVTKLKPNDSRRGVHDDIQGELRKVLKEAFDRAGIIMPVPQTVGVVTDSDDE